jgi:hypothetical protein
MNRPSGRLHELLHKVPGVPPHSEAERLNANATAARIHGRHPRLVNPVAHHANPPRVLVAWQEWIGRLVRRDRA